MFLRCFTLVTSLPPFFPKNVMGWGSNGEARFLTVIVKPNETVHTVALKANAGAVHAKGI